MSLDIRQKLALQKEASQIRKDLATATNIRAKLDMQKRWSNIIKTLKGEAVAKQVKELDEKANEAATGNNALPEPTDAQKEAGNYKKGHVQVHGIDITIENPKGSTRSGVDDDGKKWSVTMKHHYGDIKGTKGADGDAVDVFIGDELESTTAFIIDQSFNGQFDEHKVMLGFSSMAEARKAYLANYDADWQGLGDITAMPIEKFKKWIFSGQKTKPAGTIQAQQQNTFLAQYVNGEFFDKEPLIFSELVKQASDEGLPLEENRTVVKSYLAANDELIDLAS